MKREAGVVLSCSGTERIRRCPRNGKRAKSLHHATVPSHGKAQTRELPALVSPETGLNQLVGIAEGDAAADKCFRCFR